MIKRLIKKFYNEAVEDVCIRILYFFNTIDTYFFVIGTVSVMIYGIGHITLVSIFIFVSLTWVLFKTADFHPIFLAFSPIFLFFLFKSTHLSLHDAYILASINFGLFVLIQFVFMSIPESIVARDSSIGIRKIWNSVLTIAPTTVSLSISVSFSTIYALIIFSRPTHLSINGIFFWITISLAAIIAHCFRPKSFVSADFRPVAKNRIADRVIVINIDGCRLDRFYEARLVFLTSLEKESSYFPNGIQTVYRALTNPAFASILTGTLPETHGIKSNNLGQSIRVEALPDIVKTKLYGSMHIKHFSKKNWDTKIVSLPMHGVYKSDDIMFDLLKNDLMLGDGTRLFIADISETDFLGHAYGSESKQYLEALKRSDLRIENFFCWMIEQNLFNDTVIIICSDHGIFHIDHSYLLFDAEKYVPFFITGAGIKKNNPLKFPASIMDIASTISYILGIKYPHSCRGRVFTDAFES